MHAPASFIPLDDSFDPWRVQPVRHTLSDHPLMQMDQIRALGKRLQERGRVRTHSDQAKADTPFNDAPSTHPAGQQGVDTLADVEKAAAWTSLLNIQTDDLYRTLVDSVLDGVKPMFDRKDPGMCYRGGWIFVTSPRAITPFHMDREHNFILQIMGKKRLYVWDPFDRSVVSELGNELFHAKHSREQVLFREELRQKAIIFDLEPGMGGFMPSTAPHLVENGDGPSVTVSFTFYTDSTQRRNLIYRGNNHLRSLGLEPAPVGRSAARDAILATAMGAYSKAKGAALRALGRPVHPADAPYAFHLTS